MAIVVVVAALLRVVVLVAAGVGTAGKLAGRVMGMVKTRLFFVVGGYQGNTRESGNPWEQAYKLTS